MKVTVLIQAESSQMIMTPESDYDKKIIGLFPTQGTEVNIAAISFSENKDGILKDTANVNSLCINLKN
jgi:hypothetical protein